MTSTRDKILDAVQDLAGDFMYYDRKNDEELSADDIETALENGDITIDEIVEAFREALG